MAVPEEPQDDDITDVNVGPQVRETAARRPPPNAAPLLLEDHHADKKMRPSVGFLLRHPAHWIALGLGSGLAPKAPGTAGTLLAWVLWALLSLALGPQALFIILLLAFPVGWWAATVTARDMGVQDPSAIVIDEVAAFWLVLWLLAPAGFFVQLAAFVLFRLFDAVKRGPVGWADRRYHDARGWLGGFGIMFDDVVAAVCAFVVTALGVWAWTAFI